MSIRPLLLATLAAGTALATLPALAQRIPVGTTVPSDDGVFISGNVVIHQFVRVGRPAMLSGGCGIGKDVPPFCITAGLERNRIGGLNTIGMRRAGLSPADRAQVQRAFALLYRSQLNVSQALERMRHEFTTGPAVDILNFVSASRRGICPMRDGHGYPEADSGV